jgi:hypothetical protein
MWSLAKRFVPPIMGIYVSVKIHETFYVMRCAPHALSFRTFFVSQAMVVIGLLNSTDSQSRFFWELRDD